MREWKYRHETSRKYSYSYFIKNQGDENAGVEISGVGLNEIALSDYIV